MHFCFLLIYCYTCFRKQVVKNKELDISLPLPLAFLFSRLVVENVEKKHM